MNNQIVESEGKLIPKLSDFGLSRSKTMNTADKTFAGGTVGYMAPELFSSLTGASEV